jgi:hypothetical protein
MIDVMLIFLDRLMSLQVGIHRTTVLGVWSTGVLYSE